MNTALYCNDCNMKRIVIDGYYTCPKCGVISDNYLTNGGEWIENIWMKYKKTVHNRSKWIYKRLRECVDSRYNNIITDDFMKVLDVMRKEKLISEGNVARYNYYILRLYSRRGIPLNCYLKDLIESKTKNKFDDQFFGIVYKKLEWDKDCNSLYFLKCFKGAYRNNRIVYYRRILMKYIL